MEKQKRHLAHMMAYGKDMPPTPNGPLNLHREKKPPQTPNEDEIFDEREFISFLSIFPLKNLNKPKNYLKSPKNDRLKIWYLSSKCNTYLSIFN